MGIDDAHLKQSCVVTEVSQTNKPIRCMRALIRIGTLLSSDSVQTHESCNDGLAKNRLKRDDKATKPPSLWTKCPAFELQSSCAACNRPIWLLWAAQSAERCYLSRFLRASASAEYFCMTAGRLTFILLVRVPLSALKGSCKISNAAMRSCGGLVADTLASSAFTMLCLSASVSWPASQIHKRLTGLLGLKASNLYLNDSHRSHMSQQSSVKACD